MVLAKYEIQESGLDASRWLISDFDTERELSGRPPPGCGDIA